jgi:hypothetical protein
MKVNGKKLFNFEAVEKYISKFEDKIYSSGDKVKALSEEAEQLDKQIDDLIEQDIMSDEENPKFARDTQNLTGRKINTEQQLKIEREKFEKLQRVFAEGLKRFFPELESQFREDLQEYNRTVEKEIFRQLSELRKQQEILLLTLRKARNSVDRSTVEYNGYCELAGETNKKKSTGGYHNNAFMPNRSFPELGAPLLNLSNIMAVEDVIFRNRAEANAMLSEDKRNTLDRALKLVDINLDEFLKELK